MRLSIGLLTGGTMTTTDALATTLRKTRPGYAEEVRFHRFLIDSWTGGGGYCGRVVQPVAGFWGSASEVYARAAVETSVLTSNPDDDALAMTYLDRFPREDAKKFAARRRLAHLGNYFRPLTALKLGFMRRVPMIRHEVPEKIEEWKEDVDGAGTSWETMVRRVELRAAVLGWCPVLFDAAPLPGQDAEPEAEGYREVSRAQAREVGADRPRMIPLLPANVLDWEVGDDGTLLWAKVRIDRFERGTWDAVPTLVSTITVWERKTWKRWEIRMRGAEGSHGDLYRAGAAYSPAEALTVEVVPKGGGSHGFGRVPLVSWRASEMVESDDPLKGESVHGDAALRNRRLFNLESEMDEHLRGQVFALLVVPTDAEKISLEVGTDNAVPVGTQSAQGYAYIAPPASVAETYENRIERMIQEIYRSARVEWVRSSAASTSAVSRRSEFDATNAALHDLATCFASAEMEAYEVVAPILAVKPEELEGTSVTAPTDFEVEALAEDLASTEAALRIDAGPTFRAKVLERIAQRFLGASVDADTWGQIVDEIEDASERNAAMQALVGNGDPFAPAEPGAQTDAEPVDTSDPKAVAGAIEKRARRRGQRGGKQKNTNDEAKTTAEE